MTPAGDAEKLPSRVASEATSMAVSDPEDLPDSGRPRPQRFAVSRKGMVATAHWAATDAGVATLKAGGNAVDAAVAAAFALGVVEPAASGLGGQTMMVLHLAGSTGPIALDGSSRAPHRALPGSLERAERLRGHRATTVPSTPATLGYALQRYGTLPLSTVLGPAIALAEDGFRISDLQAALTRREHEHLRAGSAGALFLREDGEPFPVGTLFRQPALAGTLQRLAGAGIEDFYVGEIAQAIAADMAANDGLLHLDDLAQIPWPLEREPLSTRFDGTEVFTFPPPAAGRTLVEMLNILSLVPPEARDPDTPRGALLLAGLIKQAFRDRRDRPFDPHFYPQVEEKTMLSLDYAQTLADGLLAQIAGSPSFADAESDLAAAPPRAQGEERGRASGSSPDAAHLDDTKGETTHLSVMDSEGNAVALTQSIERVFGSFEASPRLGFLYNNYMSAFEHRDISHPYYLRPNAVPWASVAPTVVLRDGVPWLVIGSPGSERITPSIIQVMLRLSTHTPYEAVDAPRLHCTVDGKVSLEASRMRDDIPEALAAAGYTVRERDPYSFFLGCVQLVLRDGDKLVGVADPRRDGSAGGPR
jgi:gamma-glutamyltranspeptidase/glutathione hydrolase